MVFGGQPAGAPHTSPSPHGKGRAVTASATSRRSAAAAAGEVPGDAGARPCVLWIQPVLREACERQAVEEALCSQRVIPTLPLGFFHT